MIFVVQLNVSVKLLNIFMRNYFNANVIRTDNAAVAYNSLLTEGKFD